MRSDTFEIESVDLAGTAEPFVRGGRHLVGRLPRAFDGIGTIGVIGWGSQGEAQAANLRDSLTGTGIDIEIGLRPGSPSAEAARARGFPVGGVADVIGRSDMVLLLVSDGALAQEWRALLAAARPGTLVGLSHGFLAGWLEATGGSFPDHVSIAAVCPKGMGSSVRRLYEQGSGINCSVAVERDVDGRTWDRAIGWAVAIGAPFVFETTLLSELRSDVFGERGALLGAPHAVVEAVYRRLVGMGDTPRRAFIRSTETITGALARAISHTGIRRAVDSFQGDARRQFEDTYAAAYPAMAAILAEIYDEVASGNELRGVVMAGERLERHPMPTVEGTGMWKVGLEVRADRADGADAGSAELDPLTAGLFVAAMIAQVDLLAAEGHPWSEIANESVIEAVDSLIPFMHSRGVASMIDGCSVTARLGARRWGPRFQAAIDQAVWPALDGDGARDEDLIERFWSHPVHDVLETLLAFRPPIDIAVPAR